MEWEKGRENKKKERRGREGVGGVGGRERMKVGGCVRGRDIVGIE